MDKKVASSTTWKEEESKLFIRYGPCFVPEREWQHQIIGQLLSHKAHIPHQKI